MFLLPSLYLLPHFWFFFPDLFCFLIFAFSCFLFFSSCFLAISCMIYFSPFFHYLFYFLIFTFLVFLFFFIYLLFATCFCHRLCCHGISVSYLDLSSSICPLRFVLKVGVHSCIKCKPMVAVIDCRSLQWQQIL